MSLIYSAPRRLEPITGMVYNRESSGQTVSLECKRGINAIAAIYGANCRYGDQGSLPGGERQDGPMKEDCYGKTSCDYQIDHLAIGDPCIGTVKDFYYAYTCNGNKYGINVGSVGVSEASGQSFTIECEGINFRIICFQMHIDKNINGLRMHNTHLQVIIGLLK